MAREEWRPASVEEAQALIAALKVADLPQSGVHFALSLTGQYDRKGDLSNFQWPYVRKLIADSKKPVLEKEQSDFSGLAVKDLFYKAATKMHFPKMDLQGDNIKVYLSINSPKKKGCVIFKSGDGKEIALINTSGEGFYTGPSALEKHAITEFCKDPLAYAKVKGQAYKRCCFCALEITNIHSRYHGYGPICAENYGLPWGDVPETARQELQAEIDKEMEKDL